MKRGNVYCAELRGLLADQLLWWAFKLDPERFIAIDQNGKQVVETGR